MAENMFDGFDHTQYREEVEERWGKDAYAQSDAWWRGLGADEKREFQQNAARLIGDWIAAAERGVDPAGDEAQRLAQRQFDWLGTATPGVTMPGTARERFVGLADMYAADPRFTATYGGAESVAFVGDAMRIYADRNL